MIRKAIQPAIAIGSIHSVPNLTMRSNGTSRKPREALQCEEIAKFLRDSYQILANSSQKDKQSVLLTQVRGSVDVITSI